MPWTLAMLVLLGSALIVSGCRRPRDGKSGSSGEDRVVVIVPPSDPVVTDTEDLPGVHLTVLGVDGASGDDGQFQPGDNVSVTFKITRDNGTLLPIEELDYGEAHISGPTFNYQVVIPETEDLRENSVANGDGSYTYTFPGLPDVYADPPNYTGANTTDVLSGTSLLSGTYTFVLIAYRNYSVGGSKITKDVGNVVMDFLVGDATTIDTREVVTNANCNQCHDNIQHHDEGLPGGGIVRDVRACVTCHVAGAEDGNDPAVAGGTPGVTTEFKVMIHKLHNGSHLPSVLGMGTKVNGARDMMLVPVPYVLIDGEDEAKDFSGVIFPVWPSFNIPMPRNYGYTLVTAPEVDTTPLSVYTAGVDAGVIGGTFENSTTPAVDTAPKFTSPSAVNGRTWQQNDTTWRSGVVACAKCHGDPDAAGPLEAPVQGDLIAAQPTRRACGSCHDDVDWTLPYRCNLKTMPAQADDSLCITCHTEGAGGTDDTIFVPRAHRHPMDSSDVSDLPPGYQGLNVHIVDLHPSGANTRLDPGETLEMTFTVTDDAGANALVLPAGLPAVQGVSPLTAAWGGVPRGGGSGYPWPETQSGWWTTFSLVLSGPTTNYNVINAVDFPTTMPAFAAGIPVSGEYKMNVPQYLFLADFGNAVAPTTPHNPTGLPIYYDPWNLVDVEEVTADNTPGPLTDGLLLNAAALAGQNWVDVVYPAGTTHLKAKDFVRVDCTAAPACTGASREFLCVGYAEVLTPTVDRVYFSSPYQTRNLLASVTKPSATAFSTLRGPWLRKSHAAGATIHKVNIANRTTAQYSITASATPNVGTAIVETAGFTTGPILVSYMTDFVMPTYYPPAFFGGPDLDETYGAWSTKPIVPGTYSLNLWTAYPWAHTDTSFPDFSSLLTKPWTSNIDYGYTYELDSYRVCTPASNTDILVNNSGIPVPAPTDFEPFAEISSQENCNACHNDIRFHGGGRRGFDTCLLCHGTSGIGLHQNYVATPSGGALPWDKGLKNTVNFRYFLHNIHEEALPTMPGGSKHCAKCHGEGPAESPQVWEVPHNRNHPTVETKPVREWYNSCGGCHTTGDAVAHMELNTAPSGEEACGTCHNVGATYGVKIMHKNR
ncbi:MAG: hypothetical protein K8T20_13090 [Planctomycetes bacterium]|nr:hypothetical protein [Planctomycetota bacterium]